jgi:hypothetical protein
MLLRPKWNAPTTTRGESDTAGLVYFGLSHPHPGGTLFQIIAVLVR